jgi:hypothetical protein
MMLDPLKNLASTDWEVGGIGARRIGGLIAIIILTGSSRDIVYNHLAAMLETIFNITI